MNRTEMEKSADRSTEAALFFPPEQVEKNAAPLCEWYEKEGRTLPWREERNPYRIWISEIMLQQTRIEAVKPYYDRFMKELPDIPALAKVPEERLLKLWEGLGYYSRARNLKKAAELLCREYGGEMPKDYELLKKLPGIGPYTAGAIASLAFQLPCPAVDGNVLRVLSRICGSSADILKTPVRREAERVLARYMPKENPGSLNEALMELGQRVCLPHGKPLCEGCPVQAFCQAEKEGNPERYPVRTGKKPRRVEEKTVLLLRSEGRFAIRKRPPKGLLAGMYEFPSLEGTLSPEETAPQIRALCPEMKLLSLSFLGNSTHLFTHVEWRMTWYLAELCPEAAHRTAEGRETAELHETAAVQDRAEAQDMTAYLAPEPLLYALPEELEERYAIPGAFAFFQKHLTNPS